MRSKNFIWISKCLLVLAMSTNIGPSHAKGQLLQKDFDGDGLLDSMDIVTGKDNSLVIGYKSSISQQEKVYTFSAFDECSQMGIYPTEKNGEVALDGSCKSKGGQVYIWLFRLDVVKSHWCLDRIVSGEQTEDPVGQPLSEYKVERLADCQVYTPSGAKVNEGELVPPEFYGKWIRSLELDMSISEKRTKALSSISFFDAAELAGYVTSKNVAVMNNLGFYLQLAKNNRAAAVILDAVVKQFPGRLVAKLNLADAYWELDHKAVAIKYYASYMRQMVREGKAKKIPERAQMRGNL